MIWYTLTQLILESLPISSSGHTALLARFFPAEFVQPWWIEFLLHGPTAIVLLIYFRKPIIQFLRERNWFSREYLWYATAICIVSAATALALVLSHFVNMEIPLVVGFFITAIALGSLRWLPVLYPRKWFCHDSISWRDIFVISIAQAIAFLIPGVSRFGSTIVAGCWSGLHPLTAFYFSCALQIPLFGGAALLGLFKTIKVGQGALLLDPLFLAVVLFSMMVAYALLALVEYLVKTERLWWLAYYVSAMVLFTYLMK